MTRSRSAIGATGATILAVLVVVAVAWYSFEPHPYAKVEQTVPTGLEARLAPALTDRPTRLGTVSVPESGIARVELRLNVTGAVEQGAVQLALTPPSGESEATRSAAIPLAALVSDQWAIFEFPSITSSDTERGDLSLQLVDAPEGTTVRWWRYRCDCVEMLRGVRGLEPDIAMWAATYSRRDRMELVLDRIDAARPTALDSTTLLIAAGVSAAASLSLYWILTYTLLRYSRVVSRRSPVRSTDQV